MPRWGGLKFTAHFVCSFINYFEPFTPISVLSCSTGTTILTPQYSVEIRWVLGSDSLDEVDPEDNLLEKNNNDTQDTLDRIPSCVRFEFWMKF